MSKKIFSILGLIGLGLLTFMLLAVFDPKLGALHWIALWVTCLAAAFGILAGAVWLYERALRHEEENLRKAANFHPKPLLHLIRIRTYKRTKQ